MKKRKMEEGEVMKCINKQQDTQKRPWALDIMKMGFLYH